MHPTLALSVVLLSWCFFRNRSMGARSLLAVALALLGWEPATAGNRVGLVLLLVALGAAASMLWDLAAGNLAERRATVAATAAGAPGAPGATGPAVLAPQPAPPRRPRWSRRSIHVRRTSRRPTVPPPPGAVRAATPMPPVPDTATATPDRWTELDRADAFGDLLEANLAGLVDAYRSGDIRAQAAFAGEIADVARGMETMLRVVVGERHRVHGLDLPGHAAPGPEGPLPPTTPGPES
jgi:hypothetical protein